VSDLHTRSDAAGELLRRWRQLAGDNSSAAEHGEALVRRWAEPHRRYHDLGHLKAVLDRVDELVRTEPQAAPDADAVRLAAFFHDAVYDPTSDDNEARSAALAQNVLVDLGVPEARVSEVVRLVLITATHVVEADDGAGAVLCDADLAVLGGDPDAYAAYAAAVREEYAHVPDGLFRIGRTRILEALLEHESIFHTSSGRSWWEDAARRNLGAELILLRAQAGRPDSSGEGPPPGAV
jgi:predicted metal-dependent HD superfamily phosphohydrolase